MSVKVVAGIQKREAARKPLAPRAKAQKAKLDEVREKVEQNRVATAAALDVEPVEPV